MNKRSRDEIFEVANKYGLSLIRFLFVDLAGQVRGKATSLPKLKERIDTGIGLVKGSIAMNCLDKLQSDTGFGAVGEIRLVPDLSTFVVLPFVANTGAVLCDMIELDKKSWHMCPRAFLERQIKEADKLGVSIQVAFEPEFMLGRRGEGGAFEPIDRTVCFGTDGMNRASRFSHRLVDCLDRQKIGVEQYYPELGHGQHEISIPHAPAMEACDRYILLKETIKGVAFEQDLILTCAPKPFEEQPGNGCHIHLSVWDKFGERNLFWAEEGLSEFGKHFVAGVVEHLPSLVAITAPSVNSYRRLQPKSWSSAYACWGYENREAAVRVPSLYWGHEMASTNIEIKCVDNCVNPYLALGAIIACGLDGCRRKLQPPEPVNCDPGSLSDEERTKLGINRLPDSLHQALVELETDVYLKAALGDTLFGTYIAVKTSEVSAFANDLDFELVQHRMRY